MENSNFVQFPYLNVTVGDKQDIQVHVLEHLSKLKDEFTRFFSEVDMTRDDLSFIRDPFVLIFILSQWTFKSKSWS